MTEGQGTVVPLSFTQLSDMVSFDHYLSMFPIEICRSGCFILSLEAEAVASLHPSDKICTFRSFASRFYIFPLCCY